MKYPDTITDDQIRELARPEPWYSAVRADCNDALSPYEPQRSWARLRCVEIIGARSCA